MNDPVKNQDAFGRIKAEIIDHMPHLKDDLDILVKERAHEAQRLKELEEFYSKERTTQYQLAKTHNILNSVYIYLQKYVEKHGEDSIDKKVFIEIEEGLKKP